MTQIKDQLQNLNLTTSPVRNNTDEQGNVKRKPRPRNHNQQGRELPTVGTEITLPQGAAVRPSYDHKTVRIVKGSNPGDWTVITDPSVRGGLIVFINGELDLEKVGKLTVTKHTYSGSSVWANLHYDEQ